MKWQIWSLGSPDPNFTLDGHQKGVNCVDYFTGGDRPYLITGSDDSTAKVCFLYPPLYIWNVCFSLCSEGTTFYGKLGLGLPNKELCSDT
jgi:WD40 repeat protein